MVTTGLAGEIERLIKGSDEMVLGALGFLTSIEGEFSNSFFLVVSLGFIL
jgi:hypothetical protein